MRTYTPKASEIQRAWHVIDAEGLVLGRLATEVARILRGKHKPIFAPHIDTGDHVIIVNADKVVLTAGQGRARRSSTATPATRAASSSRPTPTCSPRKPAGGRAPLGPRHAARRTASAARCSRSSRSTPGPTHPHAAQQPAAARARPHAPGRS